MLAGALVGVIFGHCCEKHFRDNATSFAGSLSERLIYMTI